MKTRGTLTGEIKFLKSSFEKCETFLLGGILNYPASIYLLQVKNRNPRTRC